MRKIAFLGLALVLSSLPGAAQDIINTVAGGGNPSGLALNADLGAPTGVVKDSSGNIYIAPNGSYVYKVDISGNLTVFAGTGYFGTKGVGGPAASAVVGDATALALDSHGNVLIVDAMNDHVWGVTPSGILLNVAGNQTASNPFGCPVGTDPCGDGGPSTQAQLNFPEGVAVAPDGSILIADTNDNRVRVIKGGIIRAFAGTGVPCPNRNANPACGDGGLAVNATLNQPYGVAVDALGRVYIADRLDNRIRRVDPSGTITTVVGDGSFCTIAPCGDGGLAGAALVSFPQAVFTDTSNNLYIADTQDSVIREVNARTGKISTVAGNYFFGFAGDGGPATAAVLNGPDGVFVDSAGNIFIADTGTQRIREVTKSTGIINTIAGGGSGGDGGPATAALLADALEVAVDSAGNQFIADTSNNRIRRVDKETQLITTVAGNGLQGYFGDGGPATSAVIGNPYGLAVDSAGNIFIAQPFFGAVRRVDAITGNIAVYAGIPFNRCLPNTSCGDGGPATSATISGPFGLALDAAGNLYVSDDNANRVRKIDNTPEHIITTVAGNLSGIPCPSGTSPCGDGGPAVNASLSTPQGIGLDGFGNLFIVDTGDNRIRKVDAATQTISAAAFNGLPNFTGDGGLALTASMNLPEEIAVDAAGNLFIGGGLDEVVRRVDAATQTVSTVAGNAFQPLTIGFSGDGGPATKATLGNFGVAVDNNGGLYITDNNRIRFVQLSPTAFLSTNNINFGNQFLNTTSLAVKVTFANTGGEDLVISGLNTTGDFAETNNCPTPLAPYQECTLKITFTPTQLGTRTGTVVITDNVAPGTQTINLTGNGVGK